MHRNTGAQGHRSTGAHFASFKFEPAAFSTDTTAMARRNWNLLLKMRKTALLAVLSVSIAVHASLGSNTLHVRGTTTYNQNSKHGTIKDRSYFKESPSAIRFEDYNEKDDRMILVDSFGSDVTRDISKDAVTNSIIGNLAISQMVRLFDFCQV